MPLSWNDIRANATQFAHDWAGETDERASAQEFWIDFFKVFGIARRRIGAFEKHVAKLGEKSGFIDFFWPGMLMVEHKSAGKDLEKALGQALDYFHGLPWPQNPSPAAKARIETCAQAVLDARDAFPDATLAQLYDPLTMPPVLLKAHKALDKAVDAAYAPRRKFTGDADRVAFLFEEYERMTSALTADAKAKPRPKKKSKTGRAKRKAAQ